MSLDDVIGIEIRRASLAERALEEAKKGGLVLESGDEGPFQLVRRFDGAYVVYRSAQVRSPTGGWVGAMMVIPKGLKNPPAVFVLDEELRHLNLPNIPDEADPDDVQGPAYSRLPLSSHLIGAGFAAALPTPRTMRRPAEKMPLADWIALINQFAKKARVDPKSLFLVATFEHAELAYRLAANVDFAGVVIEAPRELMFVEMAAKMEEEERLKEAKAAKKKKGEEAVPEEELRFGFFNSRSHAGFYSHYSRSLKEPLLLILAKDAPDYERTQKTLLAALVAAKTPFSAVMLDRWSRSPISAEEAAEEQRQQIAAVEGSGEVEAGGGRGGRGGGRGPARSPSAFRYDRDVFKEWIARMEGFLVEHAQTKPLYLPAPDPSGRIGGGRGGDVFKSLEGRAPESTGEESGGDAGGGGE